MGTGIPTTTTSRPSTRQSEHNDNAPRTSITLPPEVRMAAPTAGQQAIEIASLNEGPREELIPKNAWQQFLGKRPFKSSYFALYRPIKTKKDKTILVLAVVLSLAAGVPLPIIGILFGKVINGFPPDEKALNDKLTQLMIVAACYFAVTWGWATCWGMVGERVSRGLREAVLEKAVGMDMAWFEVEGTDISQKLTADTQTIQLGTSEKAGLFIQSIAYFLAAFIAGFVINARLTGILFIAVIPTMAIVICYGSYIVSKFAKKATEAAQRGSAVAEGAISAVRVVQAFGALTKLSGNYLDCLSEASRLGIQRSIFGAIMLGCVFFVAYSANALAFFEGSRLIASAGFDRGEGAGTVYTVVFLILDASFVIGSFGPFIQTFALAAGAGEKILAILDKEQPVIDVFSTEGIEPTAEDFESHDISVESISFAYPARSAVKVLKDVSLTFPANKVTAIVGHSGSGKSTIAGLVLRFYDPASGRVLLGNTDIKEFNIAKYRRQIALVDQEPILFTGTILDNIRHGLYANPENQNLSEQEVESRCIQAARDSNAYEFISRLPEGFSTAIGGSQATQLSGGQKQRIALARALVGQPRVLVLDEPTSALDANSEAAILDALENVSASRGRTTIMIAHRLATVRRADKIVVMSDGKVLEEGDHESLLAKGGAYFDMVRAQKLNSNSETSSISTADTKVDELAEYIAPAETKDGAKQKVVEAAPVQKKEYSAATLIRRCVSMSKPDSLWILLGLCGSIVSGGIIIGEAIIFGNLIATLNDQQDLAELKKNAAFFCLMFFILSLIALCAYITSGSSFGIVSERLIRRVRVKSLETILRQDIEWFHEADHSPSALMSMLNMDAGHLSGLSGVILGTIFTVLTSMGGGIILAHIVAWKVAVVLLAAVPVVLFSGFMRLRILAKFQQRHETAYLGASTLATEAVNSIRTVSSLGREKDIISLYRQAVDKPYKESLRFIVWGNVWLAFALAITYFVYALAYWWGARQVREGFCSARDFFIVLPALLFSAQASGQLFSLAPEVSRAQSAAASIFRLHDQRPSIDKTHEGAISTTSTAPNVSSTAGSSVEFQNVHFHYASRPNNPVLRSLSLTIKPGQFVAFVGSSGAGKSTALALLERFYDPTEGKVLVDGVDIKSLPVAAHRSHLSLVSQEPCLFPGSIFFNVGLGKAGGEPTQQEVEAACTRCGLHDFIMGLPEGYQTDCGTNGSLLSGGQKQRISIARALMRDPSILILDEATSALDTHSEKLVQESIAAASKGRTCIAVAHRLSSIQKADCIYVFEEGRVVEIGKHEDLIRINGGVYASMSRRQELA